MFSQGELTQVGSEVDVELIESMARDGSFYYNRTMDCHQWERPVQELYRQPKTESQNGGAATPQRGTRRERAAINSATNHVARRKRFRPPVQTTGAWQVRQGDDAYMGELHERVSYALGQRKCGDKYVEELH